jgi:D-lactate dehydrogenase
LPKLKVIATRSTGYDHINIAACKSRNILVCNVPGYGENTVAEHTFALILALSRKVQKSYVRVMKDDFSIDGLQGFDLNGKTLGVIGTGRIGKHVMKIAKGFGMHVVAFDAHPDPFVAELLHFKYVNSVNAVLKNSDIVTLHVPSASDTKKLIGKKEISIMKQGALLINTARGDLVDTEALYQALKSGKLGGAGLDVIEGEDLIKEEKELLSSKGNEEKLRQVYRDLAIFKLDNVVFTPHIGFNSKEAIERILSTTSDNIVNTIRGSPQNVVNV